MLTEKGTLTYGLDVDGVVHTEFELRMPTMADVENALEAAGEGASQARINRHTWALTMTRLGSLPPEKITAELLGGLVDTEYGLLQAAEDALRGKLRAARGCSGNSGSPSLPSCGTESA